MPNTIKHKRSSTVGLVPGTGSIDQAELAINIADGKLYTKNSGNTIINLGVTSISGTYITPNSGNFINALSLNNNPVWHSGNFDTNNIVRMTGSQSISGSKTFNAQPTFLSGLLAAGTCRFTVPNLVFNIDGGDLDPGIYGDALKFDVDMDNGQGYTTTLKTSGPGTNITIRLPNNSGLLVLDSDLSNITISAGSGLLGGGTIIQSRTFNVGQGDGISVSADVVAVNSTVIRTTGSQNISGNLTLNNNTIGLYDTSVLDLGTISGTNSVNCGQDRQIQTLTLNGVTTTFTKGSGWPTSNSVSRETTLNIFASGNTSVTWTIVNDWYRQPDSPLPSGRHIVLLRSIGSGTMQGHYIGNKTN